MTSAFLFINSEFLFIEEVRNKLKELVSERIRKVDKITGTVTVIIAGDN
jgi:hypothetical protein